MDTCAHLTHNATTPQVLTSVIVNLDSLVMDPIVLTLMSVRRVLVQLTVVIVRTLTDPTTAGRATLEMDTCAPGS